MQAKRILLAERPKGTPTKANFRVEHVDLPALEDGQVLVESLYVSVDPYMRGRMNDVKSYVAPYEVGGVIEGGVVGRVVETKSDLLVVGDNVIGGYGWQTHAVVAANVLRKVDTSLAPMTTALGVLGMTGMTAYFGLLDIGQPKPDETVVVSGAAGAVGMIVGQIAKIKGARVVGIAGSQAKCDFLVQRLGFDAAVDYKDPDFKQSFAKACPGGVDVYFENVGGEVSDVVMRRINRGARIPVCGQIALYNLEKMDVGPRVQTTLLVNSAVMQGFTINNYSKRFGEALTALSTWVASGQIQYQETIVEGFDNMIDAFLALFTGGNTGKLLVKVAE